MDGFNTGFSDGFGNGFIGNAFPRIFTIIFLLIFGFILFGVITAIRQGIKNSNSPVLTVEAKVVAKRTSVSHSTNNTVDGFASSSSSTWYYATFEVESGDRMEFSVSGREYGMLAEGDYGKLKFQGTRYLEFTRNTAL
ncbi:DUF2500 domain-containing protein [Anaerocolumna sp. AGMB13020]|uniref:DUF2500 domain-containing protein n=1 Tax=Anaerocolumna sp. AGMB13020 TaxID=3081750 RepID=UPI002952DA0F|nr:DUF2500 domain-containing protein [Anaerocolumna sp. AGMB13020]WOO35717.1 DUF2500 domain-containing protein [Anaerocolumna sp. AGMB13020]